MADQLPPPRLPATGRPADAVLEDLQGFRAADADWRRARTWSLVYHAGSAHDELIRAAHDEYLFENALSPTAFPSLARMEADVVAMLVDLVGGDPRVAGGTMASGGTEATFLAVKAHRDAARHEGRVSRGHLVVTATAHPAFHKAAEVLDLDVTVVPFGRDYRADVDAVAAALRPETILLGASAPCYPYGALDPIGELGALATARGVGLHVDASLGGFFLSVLRGEGQPIPPFGLDVPGVTSMAVDLHKYGFAAKGASAILYADRALRRRQYFTNADWPGGTLSSPTLLGTRSGGPIAAAWAALHHLGRDGYAALFSRVMAARERLIAGLEALGFELLGEPPIGVFAMAAPGLDVHTVADRLGELGWRVDRQQEPDALHFIVQPDHAQVIDAFVADVASILDRLSDGGASPSRRGRLVYGQTAVVDDDGDVDLDRVLRDHIDARFH